MTKRNVLIAVASIAAVAGIGMGVGLALTGDPASPAATFRPPVASPSPTPGVDPYEVWLDRAPDGAPELSRQDASTRAYLGCGQTWPPGTVDAILQEVYADYLDCPN